MLNGHASLSQFESRHILPFLTNLHNFVFNVRWWCHQRTNTPISIPRTHHSARIFASPNVEYNLLVYHQCFCPSLRFYNVLFIFYGKCLKTAALFGFTRDFFFILAWNDRIFDMSDVYNEVCKINNVRY